MEIVSYLLGKQAGGGGGANLQTKSVSIVENGTTNVLPDTGYDGLSSVEVITNVPQPSGTINITENGSNIDIAQYALANVNVGGSTEVVEKDVNFYDYDGTRVYSYTKSEFLNLSELPANPTHEGLTAQGWNWSFNDMQSYVTNYGQLDVGQMYITSDGSTQIFITLSSANALSLRLNYNLNGRINIEWGDGTASTYVNGSSLSSYQYREHIYTTTGNYVIKIIPQNAGTQFKLLARTNTSSYETFLKAPSKSGDYFINCVTEIRYGTNIDTIDDYFFYRMYNLKKVTIPNTITTIGTTTSTNVFSNCGLDTLIIPNSVTTLGSITNANYLTKLLLPNINLTFTGNYFISNCYLLKKIFIPMASAVITRISGTYNLEKIIIPNTITSLGQIIMASHLKEMNLSNNITTFGGISSLSSLRYIKIPKTLVTFQNNCFQNMYGMDYIDFSDHEQIPTITSTTFNNVENNNFSIIVPDALYDDWKVAQYWSTWANNIIKASDYTG